MSIKTPKRTTEQTERVELIRAINTESESNDLQLRGVRWERAVFNGSTERLQQALAHLREARELLRSEGRAEAPTFDVVVTGLGESVARVVPKTAAAREWLDDNVGHEPWQWLGPALCVEHRYLAPLLGGMELAGFRITGGR
jgi:hypothetical protein